MKRGAGRIVVIGDLNGAYDALIEILVGTGLVNRRLRWIGGRDELVQMGDVFNRGGGALQAFRLLRSLARQARQAGGRVTVLLGNHEVMTALRHEGYCTEAEYLAFASPAERRAWPGRVQRAMRRLIKQRPRGVVTPIEPRLEAWKVEHAPGRAAMRRALGPRGALGRAIRALPVAHLSGETLFVHAGLLPAWAKLGLAGLDEAAGQAWAAVRKNQLWSLQKRSIFRSADGPLWNRSLARGDAGSLAQLRETLRLLGARRMVVGHTQTQSLPGGEVGVIALLAQARLVVVDVGLGEGEGMPRTALIIEGRRGSEWTPQGVRRLWQR